MGNRKIAADATKATIWFLLTADRNSVIPVMAEGTGKGQQNLILNQRTAGDVEGDERLCIVVGGKQNAAVQPLSSVKGKSKEQGKGRNHCGGDKGGENTGSYLCRSAFCPAVPAGQQEIVYPFILAGKDGSQQDNDRQSKAKENQHQVPDGGEPSVHIADSDFLLTEHI